jgi:signal transduction histidine kinase
VLLSLGVAAGCYGVAHQSIEGEARERFYNQARSTQITIAVSLKAYTEVLRGSASYFQVSDSVTRDSFRRYVQGLDLPHNFPAIDSLNFAEYFNDAERPAFEARMRATKNSLDGYPELVIHPAGRRANYAVLTLIEPLTGYSDRVGLDIATRPGVAHSLFLARDLGQMSSTSRPIPLHHATNQIGMAMRIPIYRKNMPLTTVAERRAACIGSVGLGFSVQRLVAAAVADLPVSDMHLVLRHRTEAVPGKPDRLMDVQLYDNQPGRRPATDETKLFRQTLPIAFHDHVWNADFSMPRRALYSRFEVALPFLAAGVGFGASLLIYALFMTLASSRRRAVRMARTMTRELRDSQTRLQHSHQRLRLLAAHADQIKEEERKRIAREIHDDLGQNLLVLRIEADVLATRTAGKHPRLHARACATLRQIDETVRSVRQIINDLRPNVLDLGLTAAVEWQVEQFRQLSGLPCELDDDGCEHDVDDRCATAFFRVLQESLSNIHQHAHASSVRVELRQVQGMLCMTISDNGVGMRAGNRQKTGSFGLVGIEERISLLGGHCTIVSSPHGGTTVTVSVPVPVGQRAAACEHDTRLRA